MSDQATHPVSIRIARPERPFALPPEHELTKHFSSDRLVFALDDRRRFTGVQTHRLTAALRWAPTPGHRERLRGLRKQLARRGRLRRLLAIALTLALCITPIFVLRETLGPRSLAPALTIGAVLVPFLWFGSLGRGGRKAVIATLKHERLCPACAEDLASTPADADGCTTCPVCDSAWRL